METRSLVSLVDDSLCLERQLMMMLNTRIETRLFTDSRPLLESLGSSGLIEEKAASKQNLQDGEINSFSWIAGTEIVADIFTKQGSHRAILDEIVLDNVLKQAKNKDNLVCFEDDEIKIKNLATKAGKKVSEEASS